MQWQISLFFSHHISETIICSLYHIHSWSSEDDSYLTCKFLKFFELSIWKFQVLLMLSICTAPRIGTNVWPFESCRIELLMKTCFLKLYTVCTTFLQQTEMWIIVSCVVAWCCKTDNQTKYLPLHLIQVSWKTPLFTIQRTVAEDSLVHITISKYVFLLLHKDMNEQVQYWSSNRYFCHILT